MAATAPDPVGAGGPARKRKAGGSKRAAAAGTAAAVADGGGSDGVEGGSAALPSLLPPCPVRDRLVVFVYELPSSLVWQPVVQMGEIYAADLMFHSMLLKDSAVLTQDPWSANCFMVPVLGSLYGGKVAWALKHPLQVKRVVAYVRSHWPFWDRHQGRDHFLWVTNDIGAVRWPTDDPELAHPIKVVHFGYNRRAPGTDPKLRMLWRGFDPLCDVVAAPHASVHVRWDEDIDEEPIDEPRLPLEGGKSTNSRSSNKRRTGVAARRRLQWGALQNAKAAAEEGAGGDGMEEGGDGMGQRQEAAGGGTGEAARSVYGLYRSMEQFVESKTRLLFFAGSFYYGGLTNDRKYSFGTRQALADWFEHRHPNNGTGALPSPPPAAQGWAAPQEVLVTSRLPRDVAYTAAIRSSLFCIAPPGWGWGIRLATYAIHGCLPVIIMERVHQPFEDLLPYQDFSLRVRQADIPHLVAMLRAVPKERMVAMYDSLRQHHRAFIWPSKYHGLAYNYTVASLHRRLQNLWSQQY